MLTFMWSHYCKCRQTLTSQTTGFHTYNNYLFPLFIHKNLDIFDVTPKVQGTNNLQNPVD